MSETCSGCRFYSTKSAGSSPCSYFHYCGRNPEPVLRKEQRPVDCRDYQHLSAPDACAFKEATNDNPVPADRCPTCGSDKREVRYVNDFGRWRAESLPGQIDTANYKPPCPDPFHDPTPAPLGDEVEAALTQLDEAIRRHPLVPRDHWALATLRTALHSKAEGEKAAFEAGFRAGLAEGPPPRVPQAQVPDRLTPTEEQ